MPSCGQFTPDPPAKTPTLLPVVPVFHRTALEQIDSQSVAQAINRRLPKNREYHFVCLVHYHEVGLKGRNRSNFERKLKENIESVVSVISGACVSRISGRLLVALNTWEDTLRATELTSKIPGVVRVSRGLMTAQDLDVICKESLWLLDKEEPFESFKVDARRANTSFPINSMEVNRLVGAWLIDQLPDKKVKMTEPDLRIHVELVEGSAILYTHTVKGIGGLPCGTSGRVVSLLSTGFDSPVATWRLIKRGALVTALHFSGRPETSDSTEHAVREIVEALGSYGGIERLCIVPFGTFQREIAQLVPPDLRVIFYRRMMILVANRVAELFDAKALVTGESLGQVASQTLDNIYVIDAVAQYPILRPLIGSDKQEIIDLAIEIGTYDISSHKREDCCTLFMPRHPQTHAKLKTIERISRELPILNWLEQIMGKIETTDIR